MCYTNKLACLALNLELGTSSSWKRPFSLKWDRSVCPDFTSRAVSVVNMKQRRQATPQTSFTEIQKHLFILTIEKICSDPTGCCWNEGSVLWHLTRSLHPNALQQQSIPPASAISHLQNAVMKMFHTLKISAGIHYWQILNWYRISVTSYTCSRAPGNMNANLLPWIPSSLRGICLSVWWLINVDNGEIPNTGRKVLWIQTLTWTHNQLRAENLTSHSSKGVLFWLHKKGQFAHLQKIQ